MPPYPKVPSITNHADFTLLVIISYLFLSDRSSPFTFHVAPFNIFYRLDLVIIVSKERCIRQISVVSFESN